MEWITHNWPWILIGIGLVWFMSRGRAGVGCCGGGPSHHTRSEAAELEGQDKPAPTKSCCH